MYDPLNEQVPGEPPPAAADPTTPEAAAVLARLTPADQLPPPSPRPTPASPKPIDVNAIPDRPCRRCGCPLKFVPHIETGAVQPLDTRAAVYAVLLDEGQAEPVAWNVAEMLANGFRMAFTWPDGQPLNMEVKGFHPSHWTTCRHASEFSRKPKGQPPKGAA